MLLNKLGSSRHSLAMPGNINERGSIPASTTRRDIGVQLVAPGERGPKESLVDKLVMSNSQSRFTPTPRQSRDSAGVRGSVVLHTLRKQARERKRRAERQRDRERKPQPVRACARRSSDTAPFGCVEEESQSERDGDRDRDRDTDRDRETERVGACLLVLSSLSRKTKRETERTLGQRERRRKRRREAERERGRTPESEPASEREREIAVCLLDMILRRHMDMLFERIVLRCCANFGLEETLTYGIWPQPRSSVVELRCFLPAGARSAKSKAAESVSCFAAEPKNK